MMNLDFKQTELRQVSDIVVPDIFYRRMMTGINTIDNDLVMFFCLLLRINRETIL